MQKSWVIIFCIQEPGLSCNCGLKQCSGQDFLRTPKKIYICTFVFVHKFVFELATRAVVRIFTIICCRESSTVLGFAHQTKTYLHGPLIRTCTQNCTRRRNACVLKPNHENFPLSLYLDAALTWVHEAWHGCHLLMWPKYFLHLLFLQHPLLHTHTHTPNPCVWMCSFQSVCPECVWYAVLLLWRQI